MRKSLHAVQFWYTCASKSTCLTDYSVFTPSPHRTLLHPSRILDHIFDSMVGIAEMTQSSQQNGGLWNLLTQCLLHLQQHKVSADPHEEELFASPAHSSLARHPISNLIRVGNIIRSHWNYDCVFEMYLSLFSPPFLTFPPIAYPAIPLPCHCAEDREIRRIARERARAKLEKDRREEEERENKREKEKMKRLEIEKFISVEKEEKAKAEDRTGTVQDEKEEIEESISLTKSDAQTVGDIEMIDALVEEAEEVSGEEDQATHLLEKNNNNFVDIKLFDDGTSCAHKSEEDDLNDLNIVMDTTSRDEEMTTIKSERDRYIDKDQQDPCSEVDTVLCDACVQFAKVKGEVPQWARDFMKREPSEKIECSREGSRVAEAMSRLASSLSDADMCMSLCESVSFRKKWGVSDGGWHSLADIATGISTLSLLTASGQCKVSGVPEHLSSTEDRAVPSTRCAHPLDWGYRGRGHLLPELRQELNPSTEWVAKREILMKGMSPSMYCVGRELYNSYTWAYNKIFQEGNQTHGAPQQRRSLRLNTGTPTYGDMCRDPSEWRGQQPESQSLKLSSTKKLPALAVVCGFSHEEIAAMEWN